MAENDDTTANADDTVANPPAPAVEPDSVPPAAPPGEPVAAAGGFTSRVWSFRAMVAVALAALVIGGGIGSAIAAVSGDDEDQMMRIGRFDGGPGRGPGGGEREFLDRVPGHQMREFREELRDGLDDDELKEMRQEMREQMKQWRKEMQERRDDAAPEATPSPSAS